MGPKPHKTQHATESQEALSGSIVVKGGNKDQAEEDPSSKKLIEENLENIIVHVYTRFGYAEVDCK